MNPKDESLEDTQELPALEPLRLRDLSAYSTKGEDFDPIGPITAPIDPLTARLITSYIILSDAEPTRYDILFAGPPPKWYQLPWLWIKGWWQR